MKFLFSVALALMLSGVAGLVYAVNLDDFNGPQLNKMWTYRDPAGTGKYSFKDGMLVLELKAGSDLYVRGTDRGVLFLMDPPDMDNFTLETCVNPAVKGSQPPASQIGPILFNEDEWAYTLWGPYNAGQDIRLEDCVGGSYRWRADTGGIAIDVNKVAIDQDVYLRIVKTGTELEFFAKNDANSDWVSGGIDKKLGPYYKPGKYKVGLFAKSWSGSIDSVFEFDYFTIPEIAKAVDPAGKLATTWSAIKR